MGEAPTSKGDHVPGPDVRASEPDEGTVTRAYLDFGTASSGLEAGKATGTPGEPDAGTRTGVDGAGGVTRPGEEGEARGGGSAPRATSRPRQVRTLLGLAAAVVALDIVTKVIVVATLSGRGPMTVIPGVLDLQLTRNGGAAFSVGSGATWLYTVLAIIVVAVVIRTARKLRSTAWAISLGAIVGGAVGNLIDRLVRAPGPLRGHVVDWIHLSHWPIFNVADSAITCGAVLAVVLSALGAGLDGRRVGRASERDGSPGSDGAATVDTSPTERAEPAGRE